MWVRSDVMCHEPSQIIEPIGPPKLTEGIREKC